MVKLKKSEKRKTYVNLAKELKKLWNMKEIVIIIVIGALGTVTKVLLPGVQDLEIRGRGETIQRTVLLKSTRTL